MGLFFTIPPQAATVEELEKRVQELEKAQKPVEKKPAYVPKLGGYIEGWYRYDDSDLSDQTTDEKKVDNEFRVRRARIDVKGNVSEKIGYRVNTALDHASPGASYSVKLWDGYITYKLHPVAFITLGQFKYPFTLEGLEGTPDRVPILRAESINDIASKLGTQGGSFRDIGIGVSGEYKDFLGLKYGIAFISGKGINTGDNNSDKDLVGRVTISPISGLTVGVSGYTGKAQGETSAIDVEERAFGIEVEYILKDLGLSFRGEYITAEWENWDVATGKAASGKDQEPKGWYLQAAYKIPPLPNLQVMARYEDYERDSKTSGSSLKTTTFGATYYLTGKTRISANYLIRDTDSSSIITAQETNATGSRIDNLFLVQLLVAY